MKTSLREAVEHARRMRVPADSSRRKCVDGGYRERQAVGAIALPGGDLGVSMALLKLGCTPQESFDIVFDFLRRNGRPYCWHTDTHDGHGETIVGCGHCDTAIKHAAHYGVDAARVAELLGIVRERRGGMEKVVLDRDHAERGILVVTSRDETVKPWDERTNTQYFIYDRERHQDFLRSLVKNSRSKGKNITYKTLLAASRRQTDATLGLLASSRGKPMIAIDFSGGRPRAAFLGNAPIIALGSSGLDLF